MDAFYAHLGQFVVRFRYVVVLAWIAVTIAGVVLFPSLNSILKPETLSSLLPASAPSIKASTMATPFYNPDYLSATLVASRDNGPLTDADQAAFDRLEDAMRGMPHVSAVHDLAISPDGKARQADVETNIGYSVGNAGSTLVDAVRKAFGTVGAPAGLTFHFTGGLATAVDSANAATASQTATQHLIYLLIIVLLLLAFRAVLAPILTLLPAALVLLLSSPVIAGAVTRLGVPASSATPTVLTVLVLGAGTDYGLFLTFRVREELQRGRSPHTAVVRAVETVGETITFSAFTVIAALMTLAFAQFGVYQSLGPALAIGIALMLLAGLTLLPALLAIFGRAVFWPTSTRPQATISDSLWSRLGSRLITRPRATLSAGLLLLGVLAVAYVGISLGGIISSQSGPSGADSTEGTAVVKVHFPAATQNPASVFLHFNQPIWSHLQSLTTTEQGLMANLLVKGVIGPLDPVGVPLTAAELAQLHSLLGPAQALPAIPSSSSPVSTPVYETYRATSQFISADGLTVQFVVILRDTSSSPKAVAAVPTLRSAVHQVAHSAGATQDGVLSQNAFAFDVAQVSQSDLSRIIPIVALVIAMLLGLVLRSITAPIYLVASVVLSYFAALGLTSIVFVRVGGNDSIDYILPFVLFIFLMALGSDYNILVMRRIREEAQVRPLRQAVEMALARTGSTVTAAGLILAGTFGVLLVTSSVTETKELGFGVAAGILMDTFLVRTLLIPALVVLLDRWNWWPSLPSRRASETEPVAPPVMLEV
jgi:RND superfamily putative drug exporter